MFQQWSEVTSREPSSTFFQRPRQEKVEATALMDLLNTYFYILSVQCDRIGRFITHFAQRANTYWGNFCKFVKSFILLAKSFLDNFYRHLATFYRSHFLRPLTGKQPNSNRFFDSLTFQKVLKWCQAKLRGRPKG